jgi:hypothetical protein
MLGCGSAATWRSGLLGLLRTVGMFGRAKIDLLRKRILLSD